MLLYLIRHAEAVDSIPDAARALSARGRHQVNLLAAFLARSRAFAPQEIWHSPYVRARETALQLTQELRTRTPLRELPGITPDDDPAAVLALLADERRPVALVGHEPHLSGLASLLVTGSAQPVAFAMKKAAVLALERAGSRWIVRWHIEPGLIGE